MTGWEQRGQSAVTFTARVGVGCTGLQARNCGASSLPRSSHSPCCHGRVICFSVYAGRSVHFGEQPAAAGAPLRSMLWVDTWLDGDEARAGEAAEIVETFRPFWESERHKKVGRGLVRGWGSARPAVAGMRCSELPTTERGHTVGRGRLPTGWRRLWRCFMPAAPGPCLLRHAHRCAVWRLLAHRPASPAALPS